mmetsp:Transcript_8037/g.20541  ORF Transcript_8037/g.20541 Transcript_8037/m.20541 type:complete len:89 (+) Transcript_8037:204-470(+)
MTRRHADLNSKKDRITIKMLLPRLLLPLLFAVPSDAWAFTSLPSISTSHATQARYKVGRGADGGEWTWIDHDDGNGGHIYRAKSNEKD